MAAKEYKLTQREAALANVIQIGVKAEIDALDHKLKGIFKEAREVTYEQGTGRTWENRHEVKEAIDHAYSASKAKTRNKAAAGGVIILLVVGTWWEQFVSLIGGK